MKSKYLTDRGQIRPHNEDAGGIFYNHASQTLAIIADGMGGHQAGDVASDLAVSFTQQKWEQSKVLTSPEETKVWLTETITEMNQFIYEHSLVVEECKGMGTTAVIAIITDEFISVAHVGDSRCYIANENGFTQMTEDHSLVNELVRSGQITTGDAEHHPRKNVVLRALGTETQVTADIVSMSWDIGDKLLLCSDGLTDKVAADELASFIQSDMSIKEIGQEMINLANKRGGEDNITLIIINHEPREAGGDTSC